jgi:hypothetical protein
MSPPRGTFALKASRRPLAISLVLLLSLATVFVSLVAPQVLRPSVGVTTITYDFDTGTPAMPVRSPTPFNQSAGGVTATFSSAYDPNAFSLQSSGTTTYVLSQFSGNYLVQSGVFRIPLDMRFDHQVTAISITFATVDYHDPNAGNATNIQLAAYLNSTGGTPVGNATAHGAFSADTYPEGVLTFDSGGRPFDYVEVSLVFVAQGATAFFVDNVTVTPVLPIPEFPGALPLVTVSLGIVAAVLVERRLAREPGS